METFEDRIEREIEDREYVTRLLGAQGLYDAAFDRYEVTEHPDDDRWLIRGEK